MIYLLYERNKTGICVNRVFGYDGIVEIPDTLNGFPVTELGAYLFSDHIDASELNKKKETGSYCTENGTEEIPTDDMPQAAGNKVEEIRLPRFLRKIGRYAFYNCFQLRRLKFYGEMKDLGAGALTGCHKMEQITVETDENGQSALRDFLTELPETLRVDIKTDGELGRFWSFLRKVWKIHRQESSKIMSMEVASVIGTVLYTKGFTRWSMTNYFRMLLPGSRSVSC